MNAVNLLNIPAFEQAIVEHRLGAGAAFLCRLEDEHDAAVEIARLAQVSRGAEQHRRVPVVAAGVHLTLDFRGMRQASRLDDRQRIHIGANTDHFARSVFLAVNNRDDAGAPDPRRDLVTAVSLQSLDDDACGAMQIIKHFRIRMEIAAYFNELFLHSRGAVDDRHGWTDLQMRS